MWCWGGLYLEYIYMILIKFIIKFKYLALFYFYSYFIRFTPHITFWNLLSLLQYVVYFKSAKKPRLIKLKKLRWIFPYSLFLANKGKNFTKRLHTSPLISVHFKKKKKRFLKRKILFRFNILYKQYPFLKKIFFQRKLQNKAKQLLLKEKHINNKKTTALNLKKKIIKKVSQFLKNQITQKFLQFLKLTVLILLKYLHL